ncbi:hypothetical protein ACVLD2_003640 [Paenibacillus sp. PvR052]
MVHEFLHRMLRQQSAHSPLYGQIWYLFSKTESPTGLSVRFVHFSANDVVGLNTEGFRTFIANPLTVLLGVGH